MSKKSKKRWKKQQKYLKKLARRQTHLQTLYSKEPLKETLETLSKEEIISPKGSSRANASLLPKALKETKVEEEIPVEAEIDPKTVYIKKDIAKILPIGAMFIIVMIVLFIWDLKTGVLLSIIKKIF